VWNGNCLKTYKSKKRRVSGVVVWKVGKFSTVENLSFDLNFRQMRQSALESALKTGSFAEVFEKPFRLFLQHIAKSPNETRIAEASRSAGIDRLSVVFLTHGNLRRALFSCLKIAL